MRSASILFLVLQIVLSGCRAGAPATKTYEIRGQVVDIRPEIRELRIAHEDIPGYMPAMTMSFGVRNARLLERLGRGDFVTATLQVTDTDAWLSSVSRIGHGEIVAAPSPDDESSAPAHSGSALLEPGQPVPDAEFVDQNGRTFRLSDARGRIVAVTFTYTRCPLPTYCPRMDRNFQAVQRAISTRPDLRGRVQLLTVSFDPSHDTPPVLHEHATALQADPDVWRFLTGAEDTIARFATAFGVAVIPEADENRTMTHNLRTGVIGPDGRLVNVLGGNEWTPDDLVAAIESAGRTGR
jgi:protein SCO1/2